jgi:L-ascorbate metabolism protein UlaG (beta-lactamase superfamily)
MYPTPDVAPHAVTIGREHQNHNYLPLVKGTPVVLRGLRDYGAEWNRIDTRVREVHVRNIPIYHTGYGVGSLKGAAFLFDFGRLCLAHLGDLAGTLTKEQLEDLGVVDIVLIPIGGRFTMNPFVAKDVLRQIRPRVAIPMHFWDDERTLGAFLEGQRYRRHPSDTISYSRETLPEELEIVVLWHAGSRPPLSP